MFIINVFKVPVLTTTDANYLYYYHKNSRHERKVDPNLAALPVDVNKEPSEQSTDDYKYNYHVARLFYGLLMENTRLNQRGRCNKTAGLHEIFSNAI